MITPAKNLAAAIVCMAFAGGVLYYVNYHIAIPAMNLNSANSRSLPNLLGVGMASMGAILALLALRDLKRMKGSGNGETPSAPSAGSQRTVACFAGLFVLYAVAVAWLGFFVSSGTFLALVLTFFKVRWKVSLTVTAAAVTVLYLLFVSFMKVPLPTGWFI